MLPYEACELFQICVKTNIDQDEVVPLECQCVVLLFLTLLPLYQAFEVMYGEKSNFVNVLFEGRFFDFSVTTLFTPSEPELTSITQSMGQDC